MHANRGARGLDVLRRAVWGWSLVALASCSSLSPAAAGIGSLAGGTAMIYYGALDAPQPKQATNFPSPLSSNGFTLRVRF
jgi:hypothetical protein